MFQNFLLKKMLASKLKDVPESERNKLLAAVEKNPQIFNQIALEVKAKTDQGVSQMDAVMEVVKGHQDELKAIL